MQEQRSARVFLVVGIRKAIIAVPGRLFGERWFQVCVLRLLKAS
jgi:hypothetical protein